MKPKDFFLTTYILLLNLVFNLMMSVPSLPLQDDGNEFTYTGSGGRDLSGNKRTAEQSCDQTLTHMNRYDAK